jgi:hypothetical protein
MSGPGTFAAIHLARALRRLRSDPMPESLITQIPDAAIRAPVDDPLARGKRMKRRTQP